jgi:hypothetical protein
LIPQNLGKANDVISHYLMGFDGVKVMGQPKLPLDFDVVKELSLEKLIAEANAS